MTKLIAKFWNNSNKLFIGYAILIPLPFVILPEDASPLAYIPLIMSGLIESVRRASRKANIESRIVPFLTGFFFAILCFAVAFKGANLVSTESGKRISDFGNCLYFSVVTWTTLGFGDIRPGDPVTKFLAAFEVVLGYSFMAVFVGALGQAFHDQLKGLSDY